MPRRPAWTRSCGVCAAQPQCGWCVQDGSGACVPNLGEEDPGTPPPSCGEGRSWRFLIADDPSLPPGPPYCPEEVASDPDADGLAAFVTELASQAGLPLRLSDCGVEESALPKLAADAARQWTTSFNPRPADTAALLTLYRQAY